MRDVKFASPLLALFSAACVLFSPAFARAQDAGADSTTASAPVAPDPAAAAAPAPVVPQATAPEAAVPPAPPAPPAAPPRVVIPPIARAASVPTNVPAPSLSDLPGWMNYKTRNHVAALPLEARLFHRRGVLLRESGNTSEAARMVRGAAELDPSYIAPHLSLAEWSLVREPSQALLRYATVIDLARQNFLLQLSLIANALYALVQAIFLGLLVTSMLVVLLHHETLRHPWIEQLARHVSAGSARIWSWGLLVIPYVLGFGIALPTLFFMAQLWPHLRARERFLFCWLGATLIALPLLTSTLDRLTLPLDDSRAPLYGVALVETEPASPERAAALRDLAERNRSNPFLQFAAGWASGRTGNLEAAESLYRRALTLWPNDDRALNNLGNVLLMRGHADEALASYVEAVKVNSMNAAAWFNQSQIFTQRFDYRAATDALSRASSLNFEMVKTYQSQGTEDGALPLVEQWMSPRRFWDALAMVRIDGSGRGALPPSWRHRIETRGWSFSLAALAALVFGVVIGQRGQRGLPLRTCGNCGRVVCRRCSERRRELALCPRCVDAEQRAESPDFARLLLLQVRQKREKGGHLVRTAFATLVPGLGLLSLRRVFSPLLILTLTLSLLGPLFGAIPPFAFEPRLALAPPGLPWQAQALAWMFLYCWSVLGYFGALSRRRMQAELLAAPVRSRAVQATTRQANSAAA